MRTKVIGTISFCLICAAALFSSCASDNGSRQPSISGGKDIAIMPTASSESPSGAVQDKNMPDWRVSYWILTLSSRHVRFKCWIHQTKLYIIIMAEPMLSIDMENRF